MKQSRKVKEKYVKKRQHSNQTDIEIFIYLFISHIMYLFMFVRMDVLIMAISCNNNKNKKYNATINVCTVYTNITFEALCMYVLVLKYVSEYCTK